MGTSWESIETRAMTYIKNDLSLEWDMKNRLPVFYNRMRAYMMEAIPLFNRPPEMLLKLKDYTEPLFSALSYTQETDESAGITIETGETGYDICSAAVQAEDDFGEIELNPIPVQSYDTATGHVVLTGSFSAGTEIMLYFYKAASFKAELNHAEQGILAFAVYNRWEHRFDNNVPERTSKIRDAGFTTVSEASMTTANRGRMEKADHDLYDMMRAYQDDLDYLDVVLNVNMN